MIEQKEVRVLILLLLYFLATSLTFADKLEFINDFDWGINYDYWENNTTYLRSNLFWFNLVVLSLAPSFFIKYFKIGKTAFWPSLALPLYWFYLLISSLLDTGREENLLISDMGFFIYGILAISGIYVLIKTILLSASIRKENKIEALENFKTRALQKLSKLNPKHNQKLLANVLGDHGEALNLLKAAYLEKDEKEKLQLMRLALHYVASEQESIEVLQKRMRMYSEIKE